MANHPRPDDDVELSPIFSRAAEASAVPERSLADHGMLPDTAYQVIHDEVMLDGNARLNLATFVGTWMDPMAQRLYAETVDKNLIDKDEYPATAAIEERCWRLLADLWQAPAAASALGTSTVGSSEAAMLAGLALKRRWQQARRAAGKPADRPNLVMSSAVQVCWEKFANYFEVEARYVPVTEDHLMLDGYELERYVDENTIAVVAIMGVTYTGCYEPVDQIAAALDRIQAETGLDVPIHVDAASGGFVAPFLQPELAWDFRLPRVASINASGHKYGLVFPGVGWVVWRHVDAVPQDMIFKVAYLGGEMPTLALNFSRPGAQVLLQYYNFLRLGRDGFTAVQQSCQDVAKYLSAGVAALGPFELLSDGSDIPVFAWRLRVGYTDKWDLHDLSAQLRQRGWMVPAYPLPDELTAQTVQRIVVRNGLSMELAGHLLDAVRECVTYLDGFTSPMPKQGRTGGAFHH
ncbi:glutamate decarboxylase [Propionicimonas sp.]|uniref:glutamate decarboxylase n=1 Tax=Propionicimonas sp. TaxID=1955623 RepID=UPI001843EAB4|nr:glutamate decarboxylase [Propionicimonas sp.]MBU3976405.1 glutamate decarboxylase [Actinomycetota bacterium]MBA3022003.1 glutamate decarboxylase [Propionicimonas sp.]MBU3987562.1 glutamate decarboxylase [Actinomycetota bacterium]MBU4006493.1 glutamate decarboxylase [Actinomycetota bacterium]MBU4065098.1 glutamate decarboxylase [Actinomycetota bacterium]